MNIKSAHTISALSLDDAVGLFYGTGSPSTEDTLNVPIGCLYFQTTTGIIFRKAASPDVWKEMAVCDRVTFTDSDANSSEYLVFYDTVREKQLTVNELCWQFARQNISRLDWIGTNSPFPIPGHKQPFAGTITGIIISIQDVINGLDVDLYYGLQKQSLLKSFSAAQGYQHFHDMSLNIDFPAETELKLRVGAAAGTHTASIIDVKIFVRWRVA